jgi:hypothetical protein
VKIDVKSTSQAEFLEKIRILTIKNVSLEEKLSRAEEEMNAVKASQKGIIDAFHSTTLKLKFANEYNEKLIKEIKDVVLRTTKQSTAHLNYVNFGDLTPRPYIKPVIFMNFSLNLQILELFSLQPPEVYTTKELMAKVNSIINEKKPYLKYSSEDG